ncbi:ABC transporter ATP-binding protein [Bacillus horti]|uniref:ABC-2 type transport system ATP-binding protein n=1 Tax=Caldalkalibacillus horti TaxID=77523 RepID=A0ABT9VWQ8_9BACI|nr:ABC transporter ATP-binding protein [Bacillus horti]MDQ0165430.1 ABC-2 type transport system ATP-binding protein [Bacillus horti]
MGTPVLNVHIEKAGYEEDKSTVENIHFSVNAGEMVGLIGPNGAGKSTTIKALLGMLKQFKGQVIFGEREEVQRIKKEESSAHGRGQYAYIPEHPVFYEELTLWEHLEMVARLNQFEGQAFIERATWLVDEFKLTKAMYEKPDSFSKGMQQKLMICIALLIQPKLYIVDEPFIGLDPIAMRRLLQLFEEEKKRGAGILLCTHVLDTAEKICDRFLLLQEGSLLAQGSLRDIRSHAHLQEGSLMDCFYELIEGGDRR